MNNLTVDLNCDLGEGCDNDAQLMKYISSANIACGYHAGDDDTMRRTVELAVANGVAIGAHPGYDDRENFGRREMHLPREQVFEIMTDQIERLDRIATEFGIKLSHVKPHGALYNQAARDPDLASAIAVAVHQHDPDLVLFGLSGSASIVEAERVGLKTASEVFADRTYTSDGRLTPRTQSNALITSTEGSLEQVMDMVKYGRVRSTDGIMVRIAAETVCLHGDGDHAVDFAAAISRTIKAAGITIAPVRVH